MNNTPSILIISVDDDPHVKYMEPYIKATGHGYMVYSPADMVNDGLINYDITNEHEKIEIFDKDNEKWVDTHTFRSIWYRRPKPISDILSFKNCDTRKFVFNEIEHTARGLLANFRGQWVNDPYRSLLADYKPHQLKIANKLGFMIPDTILTTDIDRAKKFYSCHNGDIIYKALEAPIFMIDGQYRVTYTTPIPSTNSQELLDAVHNCPTLLQQRIKKKYELRITVVGTEFFCAKIDSQAHKNSSIDWRKHQNRNDVSVDPFDPPESIKAMCSQFMQYFNLVYSAFDFVVDIDDQIVFMENNPHGQWAWVQEATGLPIAQALTTLLTK